MTIEVLVAIGPGSAQGLKFGSVGHSDFGFDSGFWPRNSDSLLGSEDDGEADGGEKSQRAAEPERGGRAEQAPETSGK